MYSQPVLPIADPQAFNAVKASIETSFSSARVGGILKSLERMKLRFRRLRDHPSQGPARHAALGEYTKLGNADQGQIRELYLATLEKVAPEVRQSFSKLYAYTDHVLDQRQHE